MGNVNKDLLKDAPSKSGVHYRLLSDESLIVVLSIPGKRVRSKVCAVIKDVRSIRIFHCFTIQ